jgi:SAM-dependent methyltransferase
MKKSSCCLVCTSNQIFPILEMFSVPTDTCRVWPSREDARAALRAPMDLCYCGDCGHVFNSSYNDELVDYETDYENSQMFSPRFRKYAEDLSDRLIANYELHGKHIVEIGGGKGDFLRFICDRGDNFGVSFGPSYKPQPGDDIPANVRFVTDYYNEKYADEPADLIVCRHVLEHFWEPRNLIAAVRRAVGNRQDLVVYFEVPNGEQTLRKQAFWEIIYQHCSYFTRSSLARIFTDFGFVIRDMRESFGGQFLSIEVSAGAEPRINGASANGKKPVASEQVGQFGAAFKATTARWRDELAKFGGNGKRVVAWGAGARAVAFLNAVDPGGGMISHVVDINPRKAHRFIPGSAQEIVPPNSLSELRPEAVVLMNGMYRDEVSSTIRDLGLDSKILVV